jgi:hypothetical protein
MLTSSMLIALFETAVVTLVLILGVAAGIFVITRKLKRIGILMVVGFLLLAFEPAVKFIVYQFILPSLNHRDVMIVVNMYAVTACISTLVKITGFGCLLAAIYFAIQPKLKEVNGQNVDDSLSPDVMNLE